ncbi:type I CRISPR-associated protein Cas7 [Vallitaleaceae bacterium 9-2]
MNKRVYGVVGVKSIMSNWNADFTGRPKTTSDDMIFGSDKALKYSMKKYWETQGESILYIKSHVIGKDGKLQPRTLEGRYSQLFGPLEKNTPSTEVLVNLFSALDVMCFGATFAEKGNNISITGAIQVGQGFNKYEHSEVEVQDILSPFSTGDDKDNSTLGKKIVSNEAHYFYPVVINPLAYEGYKELIDNFEGFTEAAYTSFVDASLTSATALATNSKVGCENEFTMFVETDIDTYLPSLSEYISFEKKDDLDIIRFEKPELLDREDIQRIQLYYNPYSVKVEGITGDKVKHMSIFTKEVI